ncbi:hypothetical protein M2459_002696 [Parabacteroides sp. PF5-5]|uniref:hypothetical protein n=1 Tax=unclassified Parabacteroides TaxID=2649774 RepID=UPI0024739FB8|nr:MULTISPECIES: hypothetical protein [unclassified Parabacteroides]MDH6306333.1 hypothetical protein [Parabacteroides sp. PH5-39]MDH6316876.1 hypothetical protein [Parabacteroides sp. PF5-13]MDH6320945.1 hypothetical protein [Parabacteroides sp. PH5-13]MDH6324677.1 hypothetical protein [Parabacteroides sp. PH5-8]MDH6328061.1 hypothetical protein [Parabacteroides sp. PH5-41]
MPFNATKKYDDCLDLLSYTESQRYKTLLSIYERDIYFNKKLIFFEKEVRPTQMNSDESTKMVLFSHLTCKSDSEEGVKKRDNFDMRRSERLHWIRHHIDACGGKGVFIFDHEDRIRGKNTTRTYIYDKPHKYVIVLEPKRSNQEYFYLLTAYYLDEEYGEKQIDKKLKNGTSRL